MYFPLIDDRYFTVSHRNGFSSREAAGSFQEPHRWCSEVSTQVMQTWPLYKTNQCQAIQQWTDHSLFSLLCLVCVHLFNRLAFICGWVNWWLRKVVASKWHGILAITQNLCCQFVDICGLTLIYDCKCLMIAYLAFMTTCYLCRTRKSTNFSFLLAKTLWRLCLTSWPASVHRRRPSQSDYQILHRHPCLPNLQPHHIWRN